MTVQTTAPGLAPVTAENAALAAFGPAQSQRTFRAALEALARPGSLHDLPDAAPGGHLGGRPAALAPLLALSDLMAPVAPLHAAAADVVAEAARITGAPVAPVAAARIVLAVARPTQEELLALPVGTPLAPERGALLVQQVEALGEAAHHTARPLCLDLEGPGVDGTAHLCVAGLGADFVAARALLCERFPTGVDVLLVSPGGQVAALPRTTRVARAVVDIAKEAGR